MRLIQAAASPAVDTDVGLMTLWYKTISCDEHFHFFSDYSQLTDQ